MIFIDMTINTAQSHLLSQYVHVSTVHFNKAIESIVTVINVH